MSEPVKDKTLELPDKLVKTTLSWLEIIADIKSPRKHWATNYSYSEDELKLWVSRIASGSLRIFTERLAIPECLGNRRIDQYLGREQVTVIREVTLETLQHERPELDYAMAKDGQLLFLYSDVEDCIIFASNVDTNRVNRILDNFGANKIGFARLFQPTLECSGDLVEEDDDRSFIAIDFVEISSEHLNKEREARNAEIERMNTMIRELLG